MRSTGKVAVVTLNRKIFFRLIEELKKRRMSFIVRKPGETIPLSVKVAVTTKEEASLVAHHRVLFCDEGNVEAKVDDAVAIAEGIVDRHRGNLVVGIDPGKTIGYAVVEGGIILKASSLNGLQELFHALRETIQANTGKQLTVKVGKGGYPAQREYNFSEQVLEYIQRQSKKHNVHVKVLLVDEQYTTVKARKKRVKRCEKDKTSAVEIALR